MAKSYCSNQRYDIDLEETIDKTAHEFLMKPYRHLLVDCEGRICEKVIKAFKKWLPVPEEKTEVLSDFLYDGFVGAALVDDILDNSSLRGGVPASHDIYGRALCIHSALYVWNLGLKNLREHYHPEASKIFSIDFENTWRGLGEDTYFRDNFICPTEEEYCEMGIRKVGLLFSFPVRAMQLLCDEGTDFSKFIKLLGLYYNILNDWKSLFLPSNFEEKGFMEDLAEGKFSFFIVHAVRSGRDDGEIMKIIRMRTEDIDIKKQCLQLLEEIGSVATTYKTLEKLDVEMREEIERLGSNMELLDILDELAVWKEK